MKKLLILSILFAIAFSVNAQEGKVGVRAGLNASNFFSDNPDDANLRYAINAGIYGRKALVGDLLHIQAEIGYSGRGSTVVRGNNEATLALGYLDVPVMASIKLIDILHIQAGIYGSYLLNANASIESGSFSFNNELDREDFKAYDYGLLAGTSLNFSPLVIGARYNFGLQNILEGNEVAEFFDSKARNSFFQLYVGFEF